MVAASSAQGRFIGEEARQRLPEVCSEMLIMGLIHRVDHHLTTLGQQRIGKATRWITLCHVGGREYENAPHALWHIPISQSVMDAIGQVDALAQTPAAYVLEGLDTRGCLQPPGSNHSYHTLAGTELALVIQHHKRAALHRAKHIHVLFLHHHAACRRSRGGACCIAGGKMLIVEDPQLHVQLITFVQQDANVTPPCFTQKIRMGTTFRTNRSATRVIHSLHALSQRRFILALQPEKWHQPRCIAGKRPVCHVKYLLMFENGVVRHVEPPRLLPIIP